MKKICVITGGGSGIGLKTAELMGEDHTVIISGRTKEKLHSSIQALQEKGIDAIAYACDVSNEKSVRELARFAAEQGDIRVVIHAAGISPEMGEAPTIMKINAIGTILVNEAFFPYMNAGSCLIDVASMAGYMLPSRLLPIKQYALSRTDKKRFYQKMLKRVSLFPKKFRPGVAYSLSKNFVSWYAKSDAARFGEKGVRVLSVSPGFIETPMGELEQGENSETMLKKCAIKRYGKVEEIAPLFRYLADERLGYLTGADILCDGGCIAGHQTGNKSAV